MASCLKEVYQPAAVLTVPPKTIEVVLRMTEEEASTLKQVINALGGDPKGPRGVVDQIGMSLYVAGVRQATHKLGIHYSVLGGVPYLHIEKGDG